MTFRRFRERGTFGATAAGLGLLCRCQLRRSAHALPALMRLAAALGTARTDVALDVGQNA